MAEQQVRSFPAGPIAGISALLLIVGGATAWLTWNSVPEKAETPPIPTAIESAPPKKIPESVSPVVVKQPVQIYLLKDNGYEFERMPTTVQVKASAKPKEVLRAAFDSLLATKSDTAIPNGTKVRNLTLQDDNIYLDLSQEFTSGGGSTSMTSRLEQVLYTATSLNENARVWISVEGQPLELLGGEGLEVPQPLDRTLFESEFNF
ncbi:MAG: GerMN domain-containing protein [Oscillatoria sp. SIO1A7]|nr:GerMN domain-containing protein [Oscillatoria sp. SIO1A7]